MTRSISRQEAMKANIKCRLNDPTIYDEERLKNFKPTLIIEEQFVQEEQNHEYWLKKLAEARANMFWNCFISFIAGSAFTVFIFNVLK